LFNDNGIRIDSTSVSEADISPLKKRNYLGIDGPSVSEADISPEGEKVQLNI
jgi:hypothetical protein